MHREIFVWRYLYGDIHREIFVWRYAWRYSYGGVHRAIWRTSVQIRTVSDERGGNCTYEDVTVTDIK